MADNEFPRRWTGPQFKTQTTPTKVERATRRKKAKASEDAEMQKVRRRDRFCRFPLCGCGKLGLPLDVAHETHRGIGGNPSGDRTMLEAMILLCRYRHRSNRISWDRKTLRIRPLTEQGLAGPCAFDVDLFELWGRSPETLRWYEVGRETARHVFAPFDKRQMEVLNVLRDMTA